MLYVATVDLAEIVWVLVKERVFLQSRCVDMRWCGNNGDIRHGGRNGKIRKGGGGKI